ncbi:very short patch repair endonuclease [Glycomyces fuscus]|nr:very short patch repair endonuclease [Glycomyces fuscus]
MSRAARTREQDRAAGGRERRSVPLSDGRHARGSIALRLLPRTRRLRAYLRWSDQGRTREKYVCEAEHDTRAANLRHAWVTARDLGLVVDLPEPADSWASSPDVSRRMRSNKGRDTKPELRLRSLLHAQGLRFRVHQRPLPDSRRTADLVFKGPRIAVFVDGCFWHGCPSHHRPSNTNATFWRDKVEGNRARDRDTDRMLTEAGWRVVRIWEHEDVASAAERVARLVRAG